MAESQYSFTSGFKGWLPKLLIGFIMIFLGIASLRITAYATTSMNERSEPTAQTGKMNLEEKWGIEVVSLRLSAADRIIDFRYRVIDTEKAIHKCALTGLAIRQAPTSHL